MRRSMTSFELNKMRGVADLEGTAPKTLKFKENEMHFAMNDSRLASMRAISSLVPVTANNDDSYRGCGGLSFCIGLSDKRESDANEHTCTNADLQTHMIDLRHRGVVSNFIKYDKHE